MLCNGLACMYLLRREYDSSNPYVSKQGCLEIPIMNKEQRNAMASLNHTYHTPFSHIEG